MGLALSLPLIVKISVISLVTLEVQMYILPEHTLACRLLISPLALSRAKAHIL